MSNADISNEDLEEFKTESLELLELAEKRLLALDKGSNDFPSAYDEIFRAFHSLKGAAGMMELNRIQAHTHEMENLLVNSKGLPSIPKELITTFLTGVDKARTMLDDENLMAEIAGVEENPEPQSAPIAEEPMPSTSTEENEEDQTYASDMPESAIEEFLTEAEEILERVSNALQLIENGKQTKDLVDGLYRDVHTLKGTAYLFSFDKIGDISHAMESSLEKVRAATHEASPQLLSALFKSLTVMESIIKKIRHKESNENFTPVVKLITKTLGTLAERLIPVAELEVTVNEEHQSSPTQLQHQETKQEVESMDNSEIAPEKINLPTVVENQKPSERDESSGSIRVPVALLDNLMALMGEMVLVRNQVLQFSSNSEDMEFLSMSKRLNVVTTEIQGEMMKTRMQPIGNILSKFNRVIRDLTHELGKEISLDIHGSETELDKSLLEAIKDPLTHIVRNSCDHGIETPDKRRSAGKPPMGHITIKSYHEGGQVVIEVIDDGKGLHREVLIQKAIEKGLIPSGAKLSDKEAFDLIFHAGFSTAAKITNVSGRGVGMDVVRTNIEKIGGSVDLASVPGEGTTIKIKVPLTLAIVPALIVESGGSKFAIPQVKLDELVRVDQSSSENRVEYLHGSPVYRLRGNILPLIELNKILGLEPSGKDINSATIAVLNAESFNFGVIIDEIHDTADIVVKPLNRLLKSLQVYAGGTILGDGSIALILDVMGLAKHAHLGSEKTTGHEDKESAKADAEIQKLLLVQLNSPTQHALDLTYVNRLEVFQRSSIELSGNQRVIRYRDTILPLISANFHLGYPKGEEKHNLSVVVITRGGKLYGIEVDGILDSILTTAELDKGLFSNPCFFGNLNTKDGLIVMINPFELISREFPAIAEAEAREAQELADRTKDLPKLKKDNQAITVLLVEDTAFFRKAIKQVLEEKNFKILTANNGSEAMDILNRSDLSIDLIVSDIEMPVMNGFQFAASVRKHPKYKKVPMLAISSRADNQYRTQGLQAGFNTYLEKLKPPVLLAAIKELLGNQEEAA